MATNTINKKLLVGVLAISGAFALASCANVKAVPTTYNNNILFDKDGNPIPTNDNIMGALYEAIASGKDSKVLDIIMEELVNEKYGVKVNDADVTIPQPAAGADLLSALGITEADASAKDSDGSTLAVPAWADFVQIPLAAGENTITFSFLKGGYSLYIGGFALAEVKAA